MVDKMEKSEKFMKVAGIIALRKIELYRTMIAEFARQNKKLDYAAEVKIKEYISRLDNGRLLAPSEKVKINPSFTLKDLNLNIKGMIKELGY